MNIQKSSMESNNHIGKAVTDALQTNREEQNNQLYAFEEKVDGRLSSIQNSSDAALWPDT